MDVTVPAYAAEAHALRNISANRRALIGSQPRIVDALGAGSTDGLTWVYGRDGALTAMSTEGRWWSGCSLPSRAAQAMFGKLATKGVTACLLAPTHSAQVRACLDLMERRQALFVVVPEVDALLAMLHCDDFSQDVREHRLWLGVGEQWLGHLDDVLTTYPGLPTPTQFIRLPEVAEEDLERYTRPAKELFTRHTSARLDILRKAQQSPPTTKRATTSKHRICVIAPGEYRLWDDSGAAAASAIIEMAEQTNLGIVAFNSDDPLLASPVALAQTSAECDAVVAANLYRSDLPGVVPSHVRWITWLTSPRIVPFDVEHPNDAVLTIDPTWQQMLSSAKWPAGQIAFAGWPEVIVPTQEDAEPVLAIIADTQDTDIDLATLELSSHRLLWSQLRNDIAADPFSVRSNPDAYLAEYLRKHRVPEDGIDRARFVNELIVPAYQQAVARLLIKHHLPLRLFGRGWNHIAEFELYAEGPVISREALHEILGSVTALVHCWPADHPHPIEAVRKPLVPRCVSAQTLVASAWERFSQPRVTVRAKGNPFETVVKLLG